MNIPIIVKSTGEKKIVDFSDYELNRDIWEIATISRPIIPRAWS